MSVQLSGGPALTNHGSGGLMIQEAITIEPASKDSNSNNGTADPERKEAKGRAKSGRNID